MGFCYLRCEGCRTLQLTVKIPDPMVIFRKLLKVWIGGEGADRRAKHLMEWPHIAVIFINAFCFSFHQKDLIVDICNLPCFMVAGSIHKSAREGISEDKLSVL